MHSIKWLPGLEERIRERRIAGSVFESIVAPRTALIVVDMQNFFCAPDNDVAQHARDIVPNINRLASALRDSGGGGYARKPGINSACIRCPSVT